MLGLPRNPKIFPWKQNSKSNLLRLPRNLAHYLIWPPSLIISYFSSKFLFLSTICNLHLPLQVMFCQLEILRSSRATHLILLWFSIKCYFTLPSFLCTLITNFSNLHLSNETRSPLYGLSWARHQFAIVSPLMSSSLFLNLPWYFQHQWLHHIRSPLWPPRSHMSSHLMSKSPIQIWSTTTWIIFPICMQMYRQNLLIGCPNCSVNFDQLSVWEFYLTGYIRSIKIFLQSHKVNYSQPSMWAYMSIELPTCQLNHL